jgi:nucleoside-diphosphate-sugar epimerase
VSQIAAGRQQIMLGDTRPTRDFNFVLDTCRGMLLLAQCDAAIGQTVNIGSNFEISIGDTLTLIRKLMGSQIDAVHDPERLRPRDSEVQRLWCDNALIRQLTGFEPQFTLEEGLRRTIEWFRQPANLARYKADLYNV